MLLDEPTAGARPAHGAGVPVHPRSSRRVQTRADRCFLSSHILSEVEAVCDRVAILRLGELLELGTLAEMRHFSALSIEATFDGAPPDVSGVPV